MADVKISQLPASTTPLAGTELVPIVQSGVTKQATVNEFGAGVGYLPAGTGAVATTVQTKLRESVSVFDFMTAAQIADVQSGAASLDVTAAIQAALTAAAGKGVYIPSGTYLVDALTVSADTYVYGDGIASTLKKRSNGDMLTLGERVTLELFCLDGQGATFTGRGCIISTGVLGNTSWRKFIDMHLLNMQSYCIEFTAPKAGYSSQIVNCRMTMAGANQWITPCVKLPTGENATLNGNRFMLGCWTFGNRMFDAGECDNFIVNGCQGAAPILNANSLKVAMTNCRVVNVGDASLANWTIDGQFGTYTNLNVANLPIVFAATCVNIKWVGNTYDNTITDNSLGAASGNEIYYLPQTNYTPTWTGSGTPAIGNGTLTCSYTRKGSFVQANISLVIGSTTTIGAGAWTFGLPFKANRPTVGSAYLINSAGVTVYLGVVFVDTNSNTFRIVTNNSSAAFVGSAQPWAWATGDKMYVSIEYPIYG